jgi:eukaryotic-like serine/threonine-protein kinase
MNNPPFERTETLGLFIRINPEAPPLLIPLLKRQQHTMTRTPQRLFEQQLKEDAAPREASAARFMAVASGLTGLIALGLAPFIGRGLSMSLAGLLFAVSAFAGIQFLLLRRGRFHPVLPWINVALEVSVPALIFVADWSARGPEYALTAPPLFFWGTLIFMSGLRGIGALSLGAGALATLEFLGVYFALARPSGADYAMVSLQWPLILTRALLLFASGVLAAIFVGHLNRRAAEAFSKLRERDVVGKYLLGERIGMGGMAEVFLATYSPEGGFEKQVAVKKILPSHADDEFFIAHFRQEASLGSRLTHQNIVQVLDFGRFGSTWFMAMEFVDGQSLRKILDTQPRHTLPLSAIVYAAHELLVALDYLHSRLDDAGYPLNLVHRDFNPPNILVSRLGEVKVTDFGIAQAASNVALTQAGIVKGKPGYLAPEQVTNSALDGRVDLFALGCTLHEMISGRGLFPVSVSNTGMMAVLDMEIPEPFSVTHETPKALQEMVLKLLERDVYQRTRNAQEALVALQRLEGFSQHLITGKQHLIDCVNLKRKGPPVAGRAPPPMRPSP